MMMDASSLKKFSISAAIASVVAVLGLMISFDQNLPADAKFIRPVLGAQWEKTDIPQQDVIFLQNTGWTQAKNVQVAIESKYESRITDERCPQIEINGGTTAMNNRYNIAFFSLYKATVLKL